MRKSICLIMGTRPGIIMFSPIIRACMKRNCDFFIIHTGQHYSLNMDQVIFDSLSLPTPKYHFKNVADKKLHGAQTAAMLEGIEKVLIKERPSIVLVGGDANTNLAGALAARKLHITLGHIEAGERSYDWRMPEEHNRRIIDNISDLMFTTNKKGLRHLEDEKVLGKTYVTGNTIVDAATQNYEIAQKDTDILVKNALTPYKFTVLTTHREENVDNPKKLNGILKGAECVIKELGLPVFFAVHPRTLLRMKQFGLEKTARDIDGLLLCDAPSYLDFLALLGNAMVVLTDSGGVQQEACILKIPCVTLRENTEWTETIEIGANRLAGTDPVQIKETTKVMLTANTNWKNPFGDGKASDRILDICINALED